MSTLPSSGPTKVAAIHDEEWARPDSDWRPSGYQPDAPTRLSYGPARPQKTGLDLNVPSERDGQPCGVRHRVRETRSTKEAKDIDGLAWSGGQ